MTQGRTLFSPTSCIVVQNIGTLSLRTLLPPTSGVVVQNVRTFRLGALPPSSCVVVQNVGALSFGTPVAVGALWLNWRSKSGTEKCESDGKDSLHLEISLE
jgi:hypothetical protein